MPEIMATRRMIRTPCTPVTMTGFDEIRASIVASCKWSSDIDFVNDSFITVGSIQALTEHVEIFRSGSLTAPRFVEHALCLAMDCQSTK
ncbi:hypothetical protein [Paraburkholderia dilworthii]|uniref:Uncharacterized protein n=1 Tax=Paraburkholderia dilworthii TaxID=948106 RepID=A0ABW9D4B2_9BURK